VSDTVFKPRSVLSGLVAPGHHGASGQTGVTITQLSGLTLASLTARSGGAAALSTSIERAFGTPLPMTPIRIAKGSTAFIWSGPERWLAIGGTADDLIGKLTAGAGALGSVTDLTGSRTIIRVSGTRARDGMMKLVPIDLDDSVFSAGSAALTVAARIPVQLSQVDGAPTYDIACSRSYGVSLCQALIAAYAEYGCDVSM
jgi:heterotetrameric sarcosine oxidase gamma subunit